MCPILKIRKRAKSLYPNERKMYIHVLTNLNIIAFLTNEFNIEKQFCFLCKRVFDFFASCKT